MARYIERAENTARLLDVSYRIVAAAACGRRRQRGVALDAAASAGCARADFMPEHERRSRRARDPLHAVRRRAIRPSIRVAACARRASNARSVRTALTTEMWESAERGLARVRGTIKPAIVSGRRAAASCSTGSRTARTCSAARCFGTMLRDEALRLQPARHLPRARRQHGAHPRHEVLRAAAATSMSAAMSTSSNGRDPALGVGASQLPLGLQDRYRPWRIADYLILPRHAALATLLLRRDQSGARRPRRTLRRRSPCLATA